MNYLITGYNEFYDGWLAWILNQHGELFDLAEGKRRRDQSIQSVSGHNETWMELCIKEVTGLVESRDRFTGEDIRFWCGSRVGLPKHHNAWGALTNVLIKRRFIVATGEHRPMKDEDSHARSTPVYRKAV